MKNVVITGANGNLGMAITKKLLASGYPVIAIVRNEASKKVLPQHDHIESYVADLSDEKSADALSEMLRSRYRIHAACFTAGGFAAGDIGGTDGTQLREQINLNFETAYYLSRRLFTHMAAEQFGRLIFIGSRPALEADAGKRMIAYGLSKALLFKYAEYINAEGKSRNVTASVIVPSIIDTPDNRKSMPDADFGKWVKAEALADLMEMIISEKGDPLREVMLKMYNNS